MGNENKAIQYYDTYKYREVKKKELIPPFDVVLSELRDKN